jgi:hypothetical protein
MVVRISDKTQNYSKVTKLLVKPNSFDSKLKNEEALLEKYRLQKQFLLNNLFI